MNNAKSSRLRGRLGKVVLNIHITKVLTADISNILWLFSLMVVDFLPSKRYLSITLFHNNMKDNKHLTILLSE